jgi:triacylglycerol lipase
VLVVFGGLAGIEMMRRLIRLVIAVMVLVGVGSGEARMVESGAVPVVFVHGNGDDAAKWIGVIWLWESNGYPKDRLYAIRFTNPSARSDDTKDEPSRSSTAFAESELSAFVAKVLGETHSSKVALVGSSRGGMTIRNYLEHGGAQHVAYVVLCGAPNHGVTATDANLNGEFNGKGAYLQGLNHVGANGSAASEVVAGVKMMTLRSDHLDKYAQPMGVAMGNPQMSTGVTYEGPALRGAENVVLPGLDHRELAFTPRAFAEMFRFITGNAPQTLAVTAEKTPMVSGLVTGFADGVATNLPAAGVHLRVIPIGDGGKAGPVGYEVTTAADGKWGPMLAKPGQEYEFDLEFGGRHVRYFKAAIPRSTELMNLRLQPVPREAATLPAGEYVLVERPQGYLSRERDAVTIDGALAKDEPSGLPSGVPLRDNFVAALPGDEAKVVLRGETIVAVGSKDLRKDLPVVDFLW